MVSASCMKPNIVHITALDLTYGMFVKITLWDPWAQVSGLGKPLVHEDLANVSLFLNLNHMREIQWAH